jgi:hypothetical protein
MRHLPQESSTDDAGVDEAAAESFPASDAPVWSATHAGAPAQSRLPVEHVHEVVRAAIRADLDRLGRVAPNGQSRRGAREALIARAMLDAGRAIVREPIDDQFLVRTVEAEQFGAEREASCVLIGARYDQEDASGAAMLLAIARALAPERLTRNVRFVAFADVPSSSAVSRTSSGGARYADRLLASGGSLHAMVSLGRMDFAREREASVVFASNLRSRAMVASATEAFRKTSRVEARALPLPSWVPGVRESEHTPFQERGWRAMMVADGPPWRLRSTTTPDADRMAAVLPGLLAVVARLAGGRP